ncbi:MAG: gamma-glutamylcyclotransferase family protein [Thermodesulfobacteriota bacterium]
MKRYFAYGSNMDRAQMNSRCPENRRIGKATLPGYRWIITTRGYANVVPCQEEAVEGVLYEISESDEAELDRYEGVASGCYEKKTVRILLNGDVTHAMIYVDPIVEEGCIEAEYVRRIENGIRDAELSPAYVERSIRKWLLS